MVVLLLRKGSVCSCEVMCLVVFVCCWLVNFWCVLWSFFLSWVWVCMFFLEMFVCMVCDGVICVGFIVKVGVEVVFVELILLDVNDLEVLFFEDEGDMVEEFFCFIIELVYIIMVVKKGLLG